MADLSDDVLMEKNISQFIEGQFPAFYRDEGPLFIAFVQAYYAWLESEGQSNYYGRRIYDNKDIDACADDFVIYFKDKYLKNIDITSITPTRQLVKHSLDLYRSKGTPRGIDLLFRAVFGVESSLYYPKDDIFRLSDGVWLVPRYLEVNPLDSNASLYHQEIVGLVSGATAFVDGVVRRMVKGKLLDIIYISAIEGVFQTGESINLTLNPLTFADCPWIIGSLSNIEVAASGTGARFNIGDIVTVTSPNGDQAKARVRSISDITGILTLDILNGGYGYTVNAEILISQNLLTLANVSPGNVFPTYFTLFETVTQPLANINYLNLTGGTWAASQNIYTYWANNLLKGTGVILNTYPATNTTGTLLVAPVSGSLNDNTIYSTGNTVSANEQLSGGYVDRTATGNVIGYAPNVFLFCSNVTGSFATGEEVRQIYANGLFQTNGLVFSSSPIASNTTLKLTNCNPLMAFQDGVTIYGQKSNATANVSSITIQLGVIGVSNSFVTYACNYLYGDSTNTNSTLSIVSGESTPAAANVSEIVDTEYIFLTYDYIQSRLTTPLNATSFGLTNVLANLQSIIDQGLTYANVEIGTILSLKNINPGAGYTAPPIIRAFEPLTYQFKKQDDILYLANVSGNFQVGEEVTQAAVSGRGRIDYANSSVAYVRRLRLLDQNNFVVTTNSTTVLVGVDSAVTANVVQVFPNTIAPYIGFNAIINNAVITGNGSITGLDVVDSGFGYLPGESLEIGDSSNNMLTVGAGYADVKTAGFSEGFYEQKGGFLDDQKKIYDGYYYQEFSYEIRTSIAFARYIDMLKQIMHVAGTQAFGAFWHVNFANTVVDVLPVNLTVST